VAAGFTQEILAERAGLSPAAISALERGTRQSPQDETLRLLLEALAPAEAERCQLLASARRLDGRTGPTPRAAAESMPTGSSAALQLNGPSIYLANAHADHVMVARLCADLGAHALVPWSDVPGIPPGTANWEQTLREAIRGARAVVYVATPAARQSRHVADELRVAEFYQRPVFALWIAGEAWIDCVPLGWGGIQYLDGRDDRYQQALNMLIDLLRGGATGPEIPVDAHPHDEPLHACRLPYKGLRAFGAGDAGDFFGRESLVADLVQALATEV
jgi:transcriptional regulator with XRE-family HTH domain